MLPNHEEQAKKTVLSLTIE